MKYARLSKFWDSLNSSFWFVPTVMVALAIVLSLVTIGVDQRHSLDIIGSLGWAYALGPNGSRAILSAIAGSMMSVATTAFSITIVALQLASSQFGPRLLRNFMQDKGNQIVLGTFISTFVYSLMVLRTINGVDKNEFVPQLAVTCAIVLAIVSIGVLIFFIHHSASSIQVDHVVHNVGSDLDAAIDRLFPQRIGSGASEAKQQESLAKIPENFEPASYPITLSCNGYIQAIDDDQLMQIAKGNGLLIKIYQRPGHFVVKGGEVARVLPRDRVTKQIAEQISSAFVTGPQRTEQQDAEFSVNQLVEIAARALSPGINDPFTAVRCVDQLGAALSRLAQKEIPSPYRFDSDHQLRLIACPVSFSDLTDASFNLIRQCAHTSVPVTIRLLEVIMMIAVSAHHPEDLAALRRHAEMIERGSHSGVSEELDLKDIKERFTMAVKTTHKSLETHRAGLMQHESE